VTLYRHRYTRTREQDPKESVVVPPEWCANPDNPKLPPEISLYPTVRQFPLIPATSITIHKSQGLSMDSAILALSRTFASGHVYVGLSRLRSPEGLILAEDDFVAKVDPHVMRYYRSIREGNADAEPPSVVP
jgi:ATP-dependent exoDNAse (exonuclease V) alpha subunit